MIASWRLVATMNVRTPLAYLLRHGETRRGAERPSEAIAPAHATWVPVTKSWAELGFSNIPDPSPATMASQVGQIPQDGGDFLLFLIQYRRIVESSDSEEHELLLKALVADFPQFKKALRPKSQSKKLRKPRAT